MERGPRILTGPLFRLSPTKIPAAQFRIVARTLTKNAVPISLRRRTPRRRIGPVADIRPSAIGGSASHRTRLMVNRLLLSLALVLSCLCMPLTAQSGISYVYDDLGRLIGVIDQSGNSAVYHYDAVGNVTSIDRYTSSQIAVISVAPERGPVGATVTIRGSGFSTTANQNAVSFNGTSAAVSSATATQLIVSVPTGATTGTVGVTTPAGSASGPSPFVVTTSLAPTITSFTPTTGLAGATVTLT